MFWFACAYCSDYFQDNADPMEDPFEKEIEAKKERVAKNEIKRLRNIARSQKVKIPGSHGLAPTLGGKEAVQNSGNELSKAADLAKKSTASLGKFQEKLSGSLEKANTEAAKKVKGPKRKFDPLVMDSATEKEKNLKLLESITSKKPKLDINKAVGKQINKEDKEKNEEKAKMNRGNKKGKGGKGKKSGKGNFKNRGAGKNFGKGKKNTGGAAKKRVGGKRR